MSIGNSVAVRGTVKSCVFRRISNNQGFAFLFRPFDIAFAVRDFIMYKDAYITSGDAITASHDPGKGVVQPFTALSIPFADP